MQLTARADQALDALPASAPRISVIVGSIGYQRLLATLIRSALPMAKIECVDPFSQTMRGSGVTFGTAADVIVLGGIGTEAEAMSALQRLREHAACPPIIMLISHELATLTAGLIAAGAAAVLLKDALSRNSLVDAILYVTARVTDGDSAVAADVAAPRQYGQFVFVAEGERVVLALDGYRPLSTLSANSLAHVEIVENLYSNTRAVVKIWLSTPHHDANDARNFCERFGYFSSLNGRNVVRYLDASIIGSWPYVVLEYLPAGDLRSRMAAALPVDTAVRILHKIAVALADVHAGGFAHMDLKPENIFFRTGGSVALIDFNISMRIGEANRDPLTGDVMGSPAYMSPEQGRGLPVDGRSDLYSAGVIFYEMLAGKQPFGGENSAQIIFKHLHEEIPLLPKRIRHLQPIVDRLLNKNPDDRFADAAELAAALQPFLKPDGITNTETRQGVKPRGGRPSS